MHVAYNLRNL